MKMPWDQYPAIRCPACGAIESFEVKPALSFHISPGKPEKRIIGSCVVCLRCDQPYVVTGQGAFVKPRKHQEPVRTDLPPRERERRDLEKLQAAVNAIPDEP